MQSVTIYCNNTKFYAHTCVTTQYYLPQVWVNFRLKSTVGFSVGYSLLEIISGGFSVLQMLLLSYNYGNGNCTHSFGLKASYFF